MHPGIQGEAEIRAKSSPQIQPKPSQSQAQASPKMPGTLTCLAKIHSSARPCPELTSLQKRDKHQQISIADEHRQQQPQTYL